MSAPAKAVDGALAGFLLQVVEDFAAQIADEASTRTTLSGFGLEGAEADPIVSYLGQRAASVTAMTTSLPQLSAQLRSSSPDLSALVAPAVDLWRSVASLSTQAPQINADWLPDEGTVLDLVLGSSVDATLRDLSPVGWAFAGSIGLVGPDVAPLRAFTDFFHSPTASIWARFSALRRNVDITVTGILTGPRTTSIVTTPVVPDELVAAEVRAKLPAATQVIQRVTFRFAGDTYGATVPVTFEVVGDAAQPPAFVAAVVRTEPWLTPLHLGQVATLTLEPLTNPMGVALTGFGTVVPIVEGSPSLSLKPTFDAGFTFGSPGGLHVQLAQPVVDVGIGAGSWGARVGVELFEVSIPADIAGPVLAVLLPRDGIRLRGRLVVAADERGLHLDGGVGLRATWPDTIRLPGVVMRDLATEIAVSGDSLSLTAAGTVVVELGPLTVVIEGLGLTQPLRLTTDGSGNLGVLDLPAPALAPPTGLGVTLDASIVKGGGFLRFGDNEVSGALELALTLGSLEIAVRAVGVFGSVDGQISFVVIMSVEFSPPIEIFLGLTLNAVGGVFGLNRSMNANELTGLVRSGQMNDLMFPHDLSSRAIQIIASVKRVFPAKSDQYVVGPMLKLGWGRPISIVTISAGVVFTFPDPTVVAIIGTFRVAIPDPDLPLIDLRADFAGTINASTGDVSFDASIVNSHIGMLDVSGDVALRAGPQGFVFSAGGFHPRFETPASIGGPMRRLSVSMSPAPILSIRAEAYFAVTASTLQFGAALFLDATLGPIGANGHISLDVLIRTEPKLAFVAELSGQFRLTFAGEDILSIQLDVLLEGPGLWHARAHASISFLFITVSGTLELSWGEDAGAGLGPAVDLPLLVATALAAPHVWNHVVPAADGGTVQLRDGASGLHPLGTLRLTQTTVPLGVGLARYGSSAVSSPDPVSVAVTATGAATSPANELFAVAQYFNLSDDEKLSKPSFVPYLAGYAVHGEGWTVTDHLTVAVVYEEETDDGAAPGSRLFLALDAAMLGWAVLGAAGRHHETELKPPLGEQLKVHDVSYGVADASTGALVSALGGGAESLRTSMRRDADHVVVADYELAAMR